MKRLCLLFICSLLFFATNINVSAKEFHRLVLPINTKQIYHDNAFSVSQTEHLNENGTSYASLRSLANELRATLTYDSSNKQYVVTRGESTLRLQQGKKGYILNDQYVSSNVPTTINKDGSLLIQLKVFTEAFADFIGFDKERNAIVITYSQVVSGGSTNSKPEVPKNQTPNAFFRTDKDSYKMGEPIYYEGLSSDDKKVVRSEWVNQKLGFFTPGPQTITIKAWDAEGLMGQYSKTITIEDELLYPEDEFYKRFTALGDKFDVNSGNALTYPIIESQMKEQGYKVVRVNSPEQITGENIHYQYSLSGAQRFAIHKQNGTDKPITLHFTVHNPSDKTATVKIPHYGSGGPYLYIYQVGKNAVGRFLETLDRPLNETITLKPGETKSLLLNTSETIMPKDTVTIYADVESDSLLTYTVATTYSNTPKEKINKLPYAERDEYHNLGHFYYSERVMTVDEQVGNEKERIVIGDGKVDTFQLGFDPYTNHTEVNAGNHGILYNISLKDVAADSVITINPRGGSYAGAFYVNGKIVDITNNGLIEGPAQSGVIYRTGKFSERVQIQFMPAAGSNMPINLLIEPIKVEPVENEEN